MWGDNDNVMAVIEAVVGKGHITLCSSGVGFNDLWSLKHNCFTSAVINKLDFVGYGIKSMDPCNTSISMMNLWGLNVKQFTILNQS